MQILPPKLIEDLSGGVVSYADLDTLPENISPHTVNMHFDFLGDVSQRYGTTKLGSTVSSSHPCQGMSQFISNDGSRNRLVSAFNGTNFAFDGTTYTSIGGGMSLAPVRYATFLNYMYRAGGGSATLTWDGIIGDGFSNYNTVNAPTGKYIIPYLQRMYVAGDPTYPQRLWFSTIATFGGAITWDTSSASNQWIDFTPVRANDVITGLDKISGLLMVFLNNSLYSFNGSSPSAQLIANVGCSSQESIAQQKGFMFFFNPTGIYMTTGGYPQEISRPVYDWISSMNPSKYSSVSGFCDQDHYYCNIGNITLTPSTKYRRGTSFTNVWLVYTISSQCWTIYSLGNSFNVFTVYTDTSSNLTYVGGDSVGNVQTLFSGTTDNGAPIYYEYDSRPYEFGSPTTTIKVIDMSCTVVNGAGAQVAISESNKPFRTIGEVTDITTIFYNVNAQSKSVQMKFFGSNTQAPVILDGFEFIIVQDQGYVRV